MSFVDRSYRTFNDQTSGTDVNVHNLYHEETYPGTTGGYPYGIFNIHYDSIYISNLDATDPIRVTFDDPDNVYMSEGEGFVIPKSQSVGPINLHASRSIHVKRHSGSGSPAYSILISRDNKL